MNFENLSKKKRIFVETLGRLGGDGSPEQLAIQAGINPKRYKEWLRDPELLRIAYHEYKKEIIPRLPQVFEALVRKAEEGDINAIKMVFQQLENFQEQSASSTNLTADDVLRIVQDERQKKSE